MMLITNFSDQDNHLARLRRLCANADELLILSPFLAQNLPPLLKELMGPSLQRFRLITNLERNSTSQIETIEALDLLRREFAKAHTEVTWSVGISERLHGKVYVFFRQGEPYSAVITSANFTANGLRNNYEWGVEVSDVQFIREIIGSIDKLPVRNLTATQIHQLHDLACAYMDSHPPAPPAVALDLSGVLGLLPPPIPNRGNVWLKPSGVAGNPVRAGDRRYEGPEVRLNFTVRRPSGIRVGDLIIVYGVGDQRLLGLFQVIGSPEYATQAEMEEEDWKKRWPWHVSAQNLAPHYASHWWEHNLYLRRLEKEYLNQHPDAPLTKTGGRSLGALNYGADKFRLDSEFAAFLIDQIWKANFAR